MTVTLRVILSVQMDSNMEPFNRAPDRFLERLAELLVVPQEGFDLLPPRDGVSSAEWLNYHCRVMHPALGGVDTEVCMIFFLLWY